MKKELEILDKKGIANFQIFLIVFSLFAFSLMISFDLVDGINGGCDSTQQSCEGDKVIQTKKNGLGDSGEPAVVAVALKRSSSNALSNFLGVGYAKGTRTLDGKYYAPAHRILKGLN